MRCCSFFLSARVCPKRGRPFGLSGARQGPTHGAGEAADDQGVVAQPVETLGEREIAGGGPGIPHGEIDRDEVQAVARVGGHDPGGPRGPGADERPRGAPGGQGVALEDVEVRPLKAEAVEVRTRAGGTEEGREILRGDRTEADTHAVDDALDAVDVAHRQKMRAERTLDGEKTRGIENPLEPGAQEKAGRVGQDVVSRGVRGADEGTACARIE